MKISTKKISITKLLIKNSWKSLSNSKFLICQLGILLTLGTTVMSTVFVANKSLSTSINELVAKSNLANFTIENNEVIENFEFDILEHNSNKNKSDELNNFVLDNQLKIYNPLKTIKINTILDNTNPEINREALFYGFGSKYKEDNTNNDENKWPNIIYSEPGKPLTINTELTDITLKNSTSDFFSIYNDLASPSDDKVKESNYEILFNKNIYTTNPFSFKLNDKNELSLSKFGIASIDGFNDTDIFTLNHGFLSDDLAFFYSTQNSFLTDKQKKAFDNYDEKMNDYSNKLYIYKPFDNYFGNFYQTPFVSTIKSSSYEDEIKNIVGSRYKYWPNNFQNYNDKLVNEFIEFFNLKSPGYFIYDYNLNSNNLIGKIDILYEIYNDTENDFHDEVVNKYEKYFKGQIKIPAIPYLTILPKDEKKIKSSKDYKKWIEDLSEENFKVNENGLKEVINEAVNNLKTLIVNEINDLFNKSDDLGKTIIRKYNEKYDIKYNLDNGLYLDPEYNSKPLNYSISKNFYVNDSNLSNFIISTTENSSAINPVNKLVTYSGVELPTLSIREFDNSEFNNLFPILQNLRDKPEKLREYFMKDEKYLYTVLNIIYNSNLLTNDYNINRLKKILDIIFDDNEYINNPNKWASTLVDNWKWSLSKFTFTGYGYEFVINPSIDGITFEIAGIYVSPESYFVSSSKNWTAFTNNSKQILNSKYVYEGLQLPYCFSVEDEQDIYNNPEKYKNHYVTNVTTGKKQFYKDFITWKNDLPDQYKINISGEDYIISGSALSAEYMYPIASNNQLLIDNDVPIIFTNTGGFAKILNKKTYNVNSYFWVENPSIFPTVNIDVIKKINLQGQQIYNKKIAYSISDSNQPNQLLYLRVNFPYTILKLVFTITLIIGTLICVLAVFFIYVLIKSIIKQNIKIFAICISNGISKHKLALSFLTIGLLLGFLTTLLGYGISLIIYPIITNSISSYWVLGTNAQLFNFGIWSLIFLIVSIFLCIASYLVIIFVLRKPTYKLLNNTNNNLKYNFLFAKMNVLFKIIKPLNLFRINYAFANFGKFIVLLFMMISFITITTTYVSTWDIFSNAYKKTENNKQYKYAIDLYSPSKQGGYYYNIPYEYFGTRKQGFTSLYDLNSSEGIYNNSFKNALTYTNENNEKLIYENLFLPNGLLLNELEGNIQFFRNRVMHLLYLDIDINIGSVYINPLNYVKTLLPSSVLNVIEKALQNQIDLAFKYYVSLANTNNPKKDIWIHQNAANLGETLWKDVSLNGEFIKDPKQWNQTNWFFQFVEIEPKKFIWKPNQNFIIDGAPNYNLNKDYIKLTIDIINLYSQNSDYKSFLETNGLTSQNYNYFVALNAIPFNKDYDETYTYLDAYNSKNNVGLKVKGIKPDSKQVTLFNEYENLDQKKKLEEYAKKYNESDPIYKKDNKAYYPIIINEVVAKKYGLSKNDTIELQIKNDFERFINKANNDTSIKTVNFIIIGITTSKSEEQYFTTQAVANKILNFSKPEIATKEDITSGNYENKWIDKNEAKEYIPFNGIFTKSESSQLITNCIPLYTFSGLTAISSGLSIDMQGTFRNQIFNNIDKINKILQVDDFINPKDPKNPTTLKKFIDRYTNTFESNQFFVSALNGVDFAFTSSVIGALLDDTLSKVLNIAVIALIPTIVIIITLMSYMMVQESKRLVALLKTLGYSDWTNTFTLTAFQFGIIGIGLLLGVGVSAIILKILSYSIFRLLLVIVNPLIIWWIVMVGLGVLLLIVSSVMFSVYSYLKRVNLPQEISYR